MAIPPRLTIGVIGSGRVGPVLAAALRRVGHRVIGATVRGDVSRVRVEALLPQVPERTAADLARTADLLILAVPDDALPGVVEAIAGSVRDDAYVMHVSGRFGIGVLAPLAARGARPMAVHPVMTFTGTSLDIARLEDCPFGITAPDAWLPVATALVIEMGGDPVPVAEADRPRYHAALAHGANHLVALVAQTLDLLAAAGVADPARLAAPLLRSALAGALEAGDQALTGPVSRGDASTVAAHLADLADDPAALASYRTLALVTVDRALAAGRISDRQADDLRSVLLVAAGELP